MHDRPLEALGGVERGHLDGVAAGSGWSARAVGPARRRTRPPSGWGRGRRSRGRGGPGPATLACRLSARTSPSSSPPGEPASSSTQVVRSPSTVAKSPVRRRRSRSADFTSGWSSSELPPRVRHGIRTRRSASSITAVWALVRTRMAWADHGDPGLWASRTARAMARASARSSANERMSGSGPSGRLARRAPGPSSSPPRPRRARARQHGVGHGQDLRRGPVVLVEGHDLAAGPAPVEAVEVAGVGAVPGVDGLVGVAHHAQVGAGRPATPSSSGLLERG